MDGQPDWQPTLLTDRLTLRPLEADDREALYEIARDPALWEQHPIHDRWRREVFDPFFDQGLKSGGALAVLRTDTGEVIGSSRFGGYYPDEGGVIEIGWTYLAPKYWGRGFNQEMKRAMLAHAFAAVAQVEFRVGDTNYRSRKALENIGAVRGQRYELEKYQGRRVVHLVYELTRDDFESGPLNRPGSASA